jgi:hypothetical protein
VKRPVLFLHLALCCALPLTAEEPLPLEEEAPEAIFQTELGSADVDFFLTGSWTASLTSSFGWIFGLESGPAPGAVPGLESEGHFVFNQIPDLTFSIWLEERYFLETSVTSGSFDDFFRENSFRMGYQGGEHEFLDHLIISNRDIGISPYPYLEVPGTGDSSLGAEALLGSGEARHELLLRSDNNEAGEAVYIGSNLVSEQELPLSGYIRGRFFKLPDANVEELVLYIEDPYGDVSGSDALSAGGRVYRYRRADLEDAFLDAGGGLVTLKQAAEGRVVVYYRKGAAEIGDASLGVDALCGTAAGELDPAGLPVDFGWGVTYLGQDMADRQVDIEGKTALRLYMPGEFSPFEILASYALAEAMPEDLSRLRVTLIPAGNPDGAAPSHVIRFRLLPDADYVSAYLDGDLRGNFRNLYPFLDDGDTEIFDPENLLYGPDRDPDPGYLRYALLISTLTPVEAYRLGADLVPGSVRVLRNGSEETRFEMDYDSGTLTFLTYIHPDDRLEIRFRRRQSLLNNTDLVFAWGNYLPLGDTLSLELATGLRWNILPGGYTEEAYSRTGTLIASSALSGENEKLSFRAAGAVTYSNPDTTGIMRMAGMEGRGFGVGLSEDTAYPAAEPVDAAMLAGVNRGKLLYKDYRDYGLLGITLMPYDNKYWSPPADQVFAYETGSKIGPYLAAGSHEGRDEGQCLVLDFDLAAGEYAGTQIPVSAGQGPADLSGLEAIIVSYRSIEVESPDNDLELYLQIGEVGEDLDGDGLLDEEPSASSAGFKFNYAGSSYLLVGGGPKNQGNNRRDTEDVDGSGQLDAEDPSVPAENIYTAPALSVSAGNDVWKVASFSLTGAGSRLKRARALRLLVADGGGSGSKGRILIDGLRLAGSGFWGNEEAFQLIAGSLEIREIQERAALDPPPRELAKVFKQVEEVFHPLGERQEVLEIAWTNAPAAPEDRTIRGLTGAASGGIDYRKINLYYRLPQISSLPLPPDDKIEFALLDTEGRGVRWGFSAQEQDAWALLAVDLDRKKVLLDGAEPAGAWASADPGRGSLSVLKIILPDGSDGVLYLDELHLTEPRGELGGAFTLDADLTLPGTLVSLGGHALLHDLKLAEKADFRSRGFAGLYGEPAQATALSSYTEADVGVSVADLRVDLLLAADRSGSGWREPSLSGGHRILLPTVPFPLQFSDAYSLRETAGGRGLYRANTLGLSVPAAGTVALDTEASSRDDLLTQAWGLDLRATGLDPVLTSASLSLKESRSGYAQAEKGYFSSWIEDYRLLLPWRSGEPLERKTGLDVSLEVATRPLGFDLSATAASWSFDFLGDLDRRSQENDLEMRIGFPWHRQRAGEAHRFTLTPGYRRSLSVTDGESGPGSFLADGRVAFQRLAAQDYFFTRVPFAELYDARTEDLFLAATSETEKAVYSGEGTLSLSRSFSSRLHDLWLPSFLELAAGKVFLKEGGTSDFYNTYSLDMRANALNLFGEYGAYPLFPYYRTDSYSASLKVILDVDHALLRQGEGYHEWLRQAEILLEHFLSLEGATGNSLTIDNRFSWQLAEPRTNPRDAYSNSLGLLYMWTRTPGRTLELRFLKAGSEPFWSHLESLEYVFRREEKVLSFHPHNLIARHESSLVFPEQGYLKAALSVGLDQERLTSGYAGGSLWRLGFRGGIEAQIAF